MDFPQEGEDAVGGNQTGRAACAVSSQMSLKKAEPLTDGHQGVSKGQITHCPKPQTHRPVSPVPSCVSMKSDRSMDQPPKLSSGPPQSYPKPQTHRPVSPVPSCVSMKSDWSMGNPLNFSSGPPQSDPKPQSQRPASPVPSCVSMKSDWSMGNPLNFSSGPPQSDPNVLRKVLTQYQFRCGVCEQLLKDPVITSCGHSFCRQCISRYWSQSGPSGDYSCPQCRKRPRTQLITNPSITMAQPHLYPSTVMAQPSAYQHSEMALHLNTSANMAQIPPYPHTDTGHRPQYSNSAMGQHNPHIQHPLYPHIHTAQISPLSPLDEHTVMGDSTHLQIEHAPVKRAKLTDVHVRKKVLMTHKASMKRRFESICEGIIRSGTQTLLNKIYTELYITEGESEEVNNEHEVWQVESASRPQTTEDTAINCNDIFKPLPGQERHIRTVMTKGIAGIGKTISVQKFILDWAEERANQDVDFMFVLPFRELNLVKHDQYSLHKLLLDFHPELRELQDDEYKDCHIVFIFDGLDESRLALNFQGNKKLSDVTQTSSVDVLMTSLIHGILLPSALIWITSRPAAASQIPSQCISQVTEVRGFNDPQKEEYFRKRISDQNQANRIISHIKATRSLHIMCHMPVFCWISATVLQQILELDDGKEAPKTLTEMFIHFLLIQITRKNQKYQEESETDRQKLLESHKGVILKLAELAFKHLENGNLMFYEEDLRECGIDVSEASVYSGVCTEIFREECVFHHKKVYCFVHLSIQEFLAALHVFVSFLNITSYFDLFELLMRAMDKALDSKNGHLDLFLRFLVGISVESNQVILNGLLTNKHSSSETIKKTCQYIKELKRKNPSPERYINLIHCLFEMNDHSLHEEVKKYLTSPDGFSGELPPAHCSALAHMLLMSEEVLDELDLSKYKTSEEGRYRLVSVVRYCQKALLADCKLTEKSCEIVASVLQSANSPLRELDLSQNDLQISGEKLVSALQSPNCKLETLRLAGCNLTEKSCEIVASALQSENCPLRELDLSQNDLQMIGEKLDSALQSPNCKLEKLRLVGCKLRGRFLALAHQGANSHLRELDMSDSELQDCGGKLLHQPLNQDCKLRLTGCRLKYSSSEVVVSVLQSYISQLSELDMSSRDLQTSEEKLLSGLRNPNCQLEKLSLCSYRLVGCKLRGRFLALTLQWANSHLRELDISDSELQDCGEELLHQSLNQDCKVRLISCRLKYSSSEVVVSVLQSYISQLRELDMSGCDLQTSEEKLLSGLRNPNCHLEKLRLVGCKLRGIFLALTLQWANSHLRELDMSDSELLDCGGELPHQSANQDSEVRLISCRLKYSSSEVVVSVLQSYISKLSELDMSGCDLQTSEEKLLSGLRIPNCHLEKLRLVGCKLKGRFLALALQWANSHLRELDISDSELQDCGGEMLHQPQNQDCKVRLISCRLKRSSCEVVVSVLQSYISQLSELDMSGCDLQTSEEKLLSGLRNSKSHLEKLRLAGCKLTEEFFGVVASAVQHMVSLTELDLSENHLNINEIQLLSALKSGISCKLQTLRHARGELRKYACELTLDPNTAYRHFSFSEGNRKVTHVSEEQPYPDHPERFDSYWPQVLCKEGLSGRCYWEAEWSGGDVVYIAVAYKSIQRKEVSGESSRFGYNDKSWRLECYGNSYYAWHNNKETAIPAPSSCSSRVGVYLDWPAGTLSFYSVSSNTLTHLHTLHSTFNEALYPGFYVWAGSSVSLCQIT
ncbi:NACHT, LRR and PYD domains-containing protein 12-like isoform X13 [Alosa sapidissima]|uniref:NACHT, LRR and PYD domains-containing protein 12-like isoform X13 n=1 Tax=Alosa sapidissima TaxID=34773 RepID=UPI001C097CBD|nr:NACHT, LRR and PYD domains-containing protein 12-like isoform X13 [Alosa sapidissima]